MNSLNLALNKLTKWRTIFAGWQLGTRTKEDPECQAVRDHREVTILLRAEVNALTAALVESGALNIERFSEQLEVEAARLDADYESKFPGVRTTQEGCVITPEASEWMSKWRP